MYWEYTYIDAHKCTIFTYLVKSNTYYGCHPRIVIILLTGTSNDYLQQLCSASMFKPQIIDAAAFNQANMVHKNVSYAVMVTYKGCLAQPVAHSCCVVIADLVSPNIWQHNSYIFEHSLSKIMHKATNSRKQFFRNPSKFLSDNLLSKQFLAQNITTSSSVDVTLHSTHW